MRDLFSPCDLGPLSLRNPIVFLPFYTAYADDAGFVTEPLLRHYATMSASGAGLIVVEAARIRHSPPPCGISAFAPEHLPGLKQLVGVIHGQGAKAVLQICHPGRFAFAPDSIAPSEVPPFGNPQLTPKAMTEQDMDEVIEDFAQSASIAVQAGFDGVELHGATGYLLASFISPLTNRRDDAYGGSLENRVRFPLRVCAAVRAKIGDFPVGYRFMAREYVPGGLTLEEGAAAAKLLAQALNPAYISVTAGMYECFALLAKSKQRVPVGFMLDEAAAVKKALPGVPVIAAGHLQTRDICRQALSEGVADAVGLGRVLFADPDWLRKIAGEHSEPVRACVLCDNCQRQASTGSPVFCSRWSKEEKADRLRGIPVQRLQKKQSEEA